MKDWIYTSFTFTIIVIAFMIQKSVPNSIRYIICIDLCDIFIGVDCLSKKKKEKKYNMSEV